MSTTSTFISMRNPLNWLRWILMAILARTVFVIVTNGHSQMTEYTELYLDDKVKTFLHLDEQHVGIIAMGVLVLGIALLIVTDYCVWVGFDKFKYKIIIILMAAAVNFFWWNFNQESFKRKKVEQHAVIAPPNLKPEATPYDEQIAFIQKELEALRAELATINATPDSAKSWSTVKAHGIRQKTISENQFLLLDKLSELQEKRNDLLEEIKTHNMAEQAEHEEAQLQAASVGVNIGKGIEVFLFSLLTVLNILSNRKKRVEMGNDTTERFVALRKNRTYEIEDSGSEKITAKSGGLFKLPSAKKLGVSERRYEKFSDALPELIRIAKAGGEGLNEFTRSYCIGDDVVPDVQPKKKNMVENARDQVVEWVRTVKPQTSAARDIFE